MNLSCFEKIFADRKPVAYGDYGYFSVLVPLVFRGNIPHLLFEVRSQKLKRQPGEVCFPGGKVEKNESPKNCAIRETFEELNIPMNHIQIINELDYIYTYSNFTLYSFLGVLHDEDVKNISVNPGEVKETFLVPFDFFMKTKPQVYTMDVSPQPPETFPYELINQKSDYNWRKGKSTVPIYQYKDHVIWGLTAKIIANMVRIIKEADLKL